MAINAIIENVFPRAMWPKPHHIRGYAMWGGVVVAGALYLVQPFDWIQTNLGLKKEEEAAH